MAYLIDKDAVVAEIKKKIRTEQGYSSGDEECGYRDCAREILSFLDTLEVKEVNFQIYIGEELENFLSKHKVYDDLDIAKHFYELGIKAQKGEKE